MTTRGGDGETWGGATSAPAGSVPPEGDGEPTAEVPPPAEAGRYTRDGLLGKGGMGLVYLARDHRLGRPVALKEAARGGEIAARLAREARVTAGLEHPGIVTVHDSGVTEDGRPFYTMRLLRGRALSAVLAERPTLSGRLALVRHYLDACNAVAYAHAEGVVHRDLKPANIMVGGFGETQVVDWGLAARIGATEPGEGGPPVPSADATATRTGAVLGTPAYMSPEQARGEAVGPAADVWSLGAILYELLSGRPPRGKGTSDEVLARARGGEMAPVRAAAPGAPPELLAIAERALAPDVAARYPDAGALAADVAAWLDGRPVNAHRYTSWELLQRLVRAWRAPLAVAGAAGLLLVTLVAIGTWRLAAERDRVAAAERDTRAALAASDGSLAQALVAEARAAMADGSSGVAAVLASRAIVLGDAPEAWGVLAGTAVEARAERIEEVPLPRCTQHAILAMSDLICVQPGRVARIVDGVPRWTWAGDALRVRVEPDRVFLTLGAEREAELDLADGRPVADDWWAFRVSGTGDWPIRPADWGLVAQSGALPGPLNLLAERLCEGSAPMHTSALLAEGAYVVACRDGRVATGQIGTWPDRWLPTAATRDALSGVVLGAASPDRRRLVLAGTKGRIAVVDLGTGDVSFDTTAHRDATRQLALSADGTRVALAGDRGDVEVRELPGLASVAHLSAPLVRDLRFLPDGTLALAGDTTMSRWRLPAARSANVIAGRDGLAAAVFSPDGRTLATAHGTRDAQLWELPSGRRRAGIDIGADTAKAVAFTPDGSTAWFALTGAGDAAPQPRPVRVDGAPTPELSAATLTALIGRLGFTATDARAPQLGARRVVILRSGILVAAAYGVGAVVFDTSTRQPAPLEGCPRVGWVDAAQAPGGERAVLVGSTGEVAILEPGPPARCAAVHTVPGAHAADVDTRGDRVVVGLDDAVVLLDAEARELWRVPHAAPGPLDVSISADGRWVAAGAADHTARLWEAATGRLRAVFAGHTERVASVDFRPDGRMLATGSWDGTARLWALDVLDEPRAGLDTRAQAEWGITLAEALTAAGR